MFVNVQQFRETYLNQGAFAISSRSDRSNLSFGKGSDHPAWDIRTRAGDPEAQAKRQTLATELSSGVIGSMTRATPRGRLNISADGVRANYFLSQTLCLVYRYVLITLNRIV